MKRKRKSGKPHGGGGARNERSLANLIPGGTSAPPGNRHTVTHGAYAGIVKAQLKTKEAEVFEALSSDLPLRESDGSAPATDALAVSLLAECLCRLESVRSYIERRGIEDDKGQLRPAATIEVRLRDQALSLAKELGMTPASRVRLGIDLLRASDAAEDAEANRAARERLDRRFEALDVTPTAFEDREQNVPDGEQKPDHAHAGFAPNKADDSEGGPDQSDAEPRDAHLAGGHDDRSVPGGRE